MFNADKILGQVLGHPAAAGFAGGLAGGMLTSKSGRKMGKKAPQYGGIAAVGALAWRAYQQHQQAKAQGTPASAAAAPPMASPPLELPPEGSAFAPPQESGRQAEVGLLILRAMIAAARADGRLDGEELQKVLSRADELDLVVAGATSEELKVEVYTASLLAIDVDTDAEKAYLSMLKARLGLEPELVDRIHAVVAAA